MHVNYVVLIIFKLDQIAPTFLWTSRLRQLINSFPKFHYAITCNEGNYEGVNIVVIAEQNRKGMLKRQYTILVYMDYKNN